MKSICSYRRRTINNEVHLIQRSGKFHPALLILPAFASLVFSYNYHAIWLMYDIVAICLLIHYAISGKRKIPQIQWLFLLGVLGYYFVIVLISEHWFMGVLSVWDTFKHLLYFPLITSISKLGSSASNRKISQIIFSFIIFAFFVQVFTVGIQYVSAVGNQQNARAFYDNIAGTFGDGGSHAVGYISVLIVTACAAFCKRWLYVVFIIIIAVMMNLASENAGFFVLLAILIVSVLLSIRAGTKFILLFGVISIIVYFLLNLSLYTEKSFGNIIISRVISMFEIPDYYDLTQGYGRSTYLYLASYLGGWFGRGPGAYSSIYLMEAYDFANIIDPRLNISEATHLIAESGFTGLFLTILLYVQFVVKIFNKLIVKVMMTLMFISCMFYSALLMNESHIFMLLLMFYFFRILEDQYSGELNYPKYPRKLSVMASQVMS